jgi:hypothetical protein
LFFVVPLSAALSSSSSSLLSLSASFSGSLCVSFCALKFLFHELDSSRRCKQCDLGFVVPMCVRVCVFWF